MNACKYEFNYRMNVVVLIRICKIIVKVLYGWLKPSCFLCICEVANLYKLYNSLYDLHTHGEQTLGMLSCCHMLLFITLT